MAWATLLQSPPLPTAGVPINGTPSRFSRVLLRVVGGDEGELGSRGPSGDRLRDVRGGAKVRVPLSVSEIGHIEEGAGGENEARNGGGVELGLTLSVSK